MEYILLVGATILVLITGFAKVRKGINSRVADFNIVSEFHGKFIQLVEGYQNGSFNEQLYHWLVTYMDKIQVMLGTYGIAHYIAQFNRIQVPNYPYIMNTIPQIRSGHVDKNDLMTCDDMMVRYLGGLKRQIDEDEKQLKKPFVWLQLGIQFYIGLPVRMLYWFGIISNSSFSRITSSQLFKILAGLGALIGFLASIVTILQGWPSLKDLLK